MNYRRVIVATALIAGLAGFSYLISRAVRNANAWLIAQRSYQIPFDEIQLASPLPEWYRGGARAFLESVRERAGVSETVPVLDMTPEQVKVMFVQSPWVESVVRVSYPPLALRVELQYREPVAQVTIPGDEPYLLDRSATILPRMDVDLERLKRSGPLVAIHGSRLTAPLDPRPGATWKPKGGIADVTSEGNGRIPAAARLAAFLVNKMRAAGSSLPPALAVRRIDPTDPHGRGLFMLNGEDTWILWGETPGEETRGQLDAEGKWALLRLWSERTTSRRLPNEEYWEFSKERLQHIRP
jgi:hypothetical protein